MEKMSKKEFWTRFGLYIAFGIVIPFAFLTWRYQLFSKVSKISIGGWGLVAILMVAIFFISLIKAVKKGLPFSYGVQVLTVLCKISIPILAVLCCLYALRDLIDQTIQFVAVLFTCETIAGLVNPLPQWAHENKVNEENNRFKDLLTSLGVIKEEEKK